MSQQYCQAKTWSQARAGGWGNSHVGCLRKAVGQVETELYGTVWACRQHSQKPPGNGWNH